MEAFFDQWFIPIFLVVFVSFMVGTLMFHFRRNCVFPSLPISYRSPRSDAFYLSLPKVGEVCMAGKEKAYLIFRRGNVRAAVIDGVLHVRLPRSMNLRLYRMTDLSVPISEVVLDPPVRWVGASDPEVNQNGFRVGPVCLSLGREIYDALKSEAQMVTERTDGL